MNITAIRIIADSDGLELDEELDFIEEVYYDLASFVTVWVGLICTGLVGNVILLFNIKSKGLERVVQYYLTNLSLTDICFTLFCIPLTIISYAMRGWLLGRLVCKLAHFFSFASVIGHCLTIMMMTVDRYLFMCHPNRCRWRTPVYVLHTTILIWIVSFILSLPIYVSYDLIDEGYYNFNSTFFAYDTYIECVQLTGTHWDTFSYWHSVITSYLLPILVIIYCYIRIVHKLSTTTNKIRMISIRERSTNRRNHVLKTVIMFVMTFLILWTPINILLTWQFYSPIHMHRKTFYRMKLIAHTLSFASPTVNPIIYGLERRKRRSLSKPTDKNSSKSQSQKLKRDRTQLTPKEEDREDTVMSNTHSVRLVSVRKSSYINKQFRKEETISITRRIAITKI